MSAMLPVFRVLLLIFEASGCWYPDKLNKRWKYIYYLWRIYYLISIIILLSFQLLDLTLVKQSLASTISNCPLIFAYFNGCVKSITIIRRKKDIEELMAMFGTDIFTPKCKTEKDLKDQADRTCRSINKYCLSVTGLIVIGLFLGCLITQSFPIHTRFLATPLDKSSWFSLAMAWGVVTSTPMAALIVASNCFLAGVMVQMCAQLEILKYRFSISVKPDYTCTIIEYQRNHIRYCLQHQLAIFQIAERIQKIFNPALHAQTAITAGNFATSVFQLMLVDVKSIEFLTVIFYILHAIEEGWIFFWYSNQVIEKSIDVRNGVYSMNWVDIQRYMRLEILNIMDRTSRPIAFTSILGIPVSTSAFSSILYSSYQAFTLFRKIT